MLPIASYFARVSGAKLIYDSHELFPEQEFSKKQSASWSKIEAKYISSCDAVITVNQSIANELEKRYHIKGVHTIYNAENPLNNKFHSNKKFHEIFNLSADKKILLLQGGLSYRRHLDVLVYAIKYVKNPNVVLVILGDGPILEKLKKLWRLKAFSNVSIFILQYHKKSYFPLLHQQM